MTPFGDSDVPKGFVKNGDTIEDLSFGGLTDTEGKLRFNYIGTKPGKDEIKIYYSGNEVHIDLGSVQVTWAGGADLVVPTFIPPVIKSEGGKTIFVTEATANIGNLSSGSSITRYYLSEDKPLDPATARVIGERLVPALEPGEKNAGAIQTFTLPSDLLPGTYSMAACADAAGLVVELDEENNCSFNLLEQQTIVATLDQVSNNSPDCSKAVPDVVSLWPPNHRPVTINIRGITDPENDPIVISIIHITQDEPLNGLGDGDTSPDGFGLGSTQAQVRAERSGKGNGRVYAIGFTAKDGQGNTCSGTVQTGVPHDQGRGVSPIDDGQRYDSTRI